MKKYLPILLLLILTYSCGEKSSTSGESEVKNSGTLKLKNGKDEIVDVKYGCIGCKEYLKDIKEFDKVIEYINEFRKDYLKYPLSYIPRNLQIKITKGDSLKYYNTGKNIEGLLLIRCQMNYIAKNGYGNELEDDSDDLLYYLNGSFKDLDEEIELPKLAEDTYEGAVNRDLIVYDNSTGESIRLVAFLSQDGFLLEIDGCVEEGAGIYFSLEGEEPMRFSNVAKFNCKGTSVINNFTKSQVEKLKTKKLKYIAVYKNRTDRVLGSVNENEQDYLMQFFELKENYKPN